jgi:5-methyltetrahydropteroyltriglutamate--homocysteine methyltransferase
MIRTPLDLRQCKAADFGLTTARSALGSIRLLHRQSAASKWAASNRLCLSGQCGFASTEEGNVLSEDEQWAKLKLIVEIAEEVWG